MLLDLLRLLREAEREGVVLSLSEISQEMGASLDVTRDMLEILARRGRVERVDYASCESGGCSTCPLRWMCSVPLEMGKGYRLAVRSGPGVPMPDGERSKGTT